MRNQYEEACVSVPDSLFQLTKDALRQCAEDLQYELDARYGDSVANPTEARRYANDMMTVEQALAALHELGSLLEPNQ